jgi:hypothetical protein
MLIIEKSPSIAAAQPNLRVSISNLSVEGELVASGEAAGLCTRFDPAPGDILVAKERGLESWHECEIIHQQDDLLTLVWSGFPDSEVFTRRLWQVGHLQLSRAHP